MKKSFTVVVFVFLIAVNMLFLAALASPVKARTITCRARCSSCVCIASDLDIWPCDCTHTDFGCHAICGLGTESTCDATGTCPPSGGGGGGAPGGGGGSGGSGSLCTDYYDPWCDFVNGW